MKTLDEEALRAKRAVINKAILQALTAQLYAGLLTRVERNVDERGLSIAVEGDILLDPLANSILDAIS